MEQAIDDHRRHLDEFLSDQQVVLEHVADTYAHKLESLNVPVQETSTATLINLALAVLNPYTLILITYIAAVAVQLALVSRSALKGRFTNFQKQPIRVQAFGYMALVSLATTWYNMFAYLFFSYNNFIQRCTLGDIEVPTVPTCDDGLRCALAKATAYALRTSQWLQNSYLFEEAWLHVVQRPFHWFWSAEVCLYAVGAWALYVIVQGKRANVPHLWAYMLLGQSCAISVAQNIFLLALAVHAPSTSNRRSAVVKNEAAALMPPPPSPAARSKAATDSLNTLSRFASLLLATIGLAFVYVVPSSMSLLLAMHAAPFLMILASSLSRSSKAFSSIDRYLQLSSIYAVIAALSLVVRLKSIYDVVVANQADKVLAVLFTHPGQLSITFDAICITITTLMQFAMEEDWPMLVATLLLGPSVAFAASLAIRESQLSKPTNSTKTSSPIKSRTSATANGLVSKTQTTVRRRKSTKASTASAAESDYESDVKTDANASTPKKRATRKSAAAPAAAKPTARRRKSAARSTDDAGETTDGGAASEAASTTSTRTRKPKRVIDAGQGDVTSTEEVPASPARKPRSRRTSASSVAETSSSRGTSRARGKARRTAAAE